MKKCSACKQPKPTSAFNKNRTKWDGLRDLCKLCHRDVNARWRLANPELAARLNRRNVARWKARNRGLVAKQDQRRRDLELNAPGGSFDPARLDYQAVVAAYGNRCSYCSGPHEVLDHAIPLSRGGSNFPENVRPACRACNLSKGTKTPEEWATAKNKLRDGRRARRTGERGASGPTRRKQAARTWPRYFSRLPGRLVSSRWCFRSSTRLLFRN